MSVKSAPQASHLRLLVSKGSLQPGHATDCIPFTGKCGQVWKRMEACILLLEYSYVRQPGNQGYLRRIDGAAQRHRRKLTPSWVSTLMQQIDYRIGYGFF